MAASSSLRINNVFAKIFKLGPDEIPETAYSIYAKSFSTKRVLNILEKRKLKNFKTRKTSRNQTK